MFRVFDGVSSMIWIEIFPVRIDVFLYQDLHFFRNINISFKTRLQILQLKNIVLPREKITCIYMCVDAFAGYR